MGKRQTTTRMVGSMIDEHIGCPSYPVCEEAPLGCIVQQGIDNVEWYGHKDNDDTNKSE